MIRPHDSARSAHLAATLLRAMGLAGSAAAAVACGGIAVIEADDDGGSGGAGSGPGGNGGAHSTASVGTATSVHTIGVTTSSSSGSQNSSGSGTFICEVVPVMGQELQYGCFIPNGSGCPAASSTVVHDELTIALSGLGCGGFNISDVPCGPDPSAMGQCCYYAMGVVLECGGRPFVVGGSARTAEPATRSDWRAAVTPGASDLDSGLRSRLAAAWTRDALDEHASVASFARLALELLAVGAPAELVSLAQRAMGDEIRHAELCFGLASAYVGEPVGPSALSMTGALGARTSLAEVASAAVREGCVGETIAAFIAGSARDGATDPAVRAALGVIARDEASHAELAWKLVAWALRTGDADVARAIEDAFAAALSSPPALRDDEVGDPRTAEHGQLSGAARRELAEQALAEVIRPCARALLAGHAERFLSRSMLGAMV